VHNAARASRVVGDMLEGYAETQRRLPKGGVVWVTRIAQLFWVLVEVAVPNSLASLVFRHGLKLLYFFEALAILLGTLLLYPTIQQFGFVAFAATATVHGAVLLLEDAMSKKVRDGERPVGGEGEEREGGEQEGGEQEGERPESERRDKGAPKGETLWQRAAKYAFAVLLPFAMIGFVFVLAALGLTFPRSIVDFMTDPPGATDSVWRTIVRGAVMFAIVAGFLLATGGGISRRLKRSRVSSAS
jgi:hypothetical protein